MNPISYEARERAAAQLHDSIARHGGRRIRFKVWTLDGVTFHVSCAKGSEFALHRAVDALPNLVQRYADIPIEQEFADPYISFPVKINPTEADTNE